jgi:hypothetical protein
LHQTNFSPAEFLDYHSNRVDQSAIIKSVDRKRFVGELDARLEAVPGVESVGIGDDYRLRELIRRPNSTSRTSRRIGG